MDSAIQQRNIVDWQTQAAAWFNNFTSDHTRKAYGVAWQQFIAFVGHDDPGAFHQEDVIAYRRHLEGLKRSQTTINQHLAALSSFYEFVIKTGLWQDNPTKGVRRKAVNPYGKATFLNGAKDEDRIFLDMIDRSTIQGKRDYAIMLIILTTAVRVSVITNARIKDVVRIGQSHYLQYTNKGGESDRAPLQSFVYQALTEYIDTRKGWKKINPDDPLFDRTEAGKKAAGYLPHHTQETNPLSQQSVNNLIRKYANEAFGKGHNIHAHSLRHTAAMNAAKHGTIGQVSRLLRHKNTRITTIYLEHVDASESDQLTETLADRYGEPHD